MLMQDNQKDFTFNPITLLKDIKDACGMFWAALRGKIPMPWHSIIWGVLFLIYFILPIDLLPEFFFSVFGFGDDLLAFVFVINKMGPEIEQYRAYKKSLKEKE